jgi:hypothetical protein
MKVLCAAGPETDDGIDKPKHCTSTRNACKLCTPLGACLAFRGIEGTIPFLHGSQGCSTYIRRYLISHFREPIDIAASNFSEESAIFGGKSNFHAGVQNVIRQYQPKMVAVATTCLSETIGEKRPEIAVMGIAGPGDPFANPVETMETLRLTRERFPGMMLCLASNGLGIGPYIEELATMNVSHVTITITAINPKIGAKIYAWVRDGKMPLRGEEAAALLLERQLAAVRELKARGIIVKVDSIIIPGINDEHIPQIAKVIGEMGVDIMNCMPLVPVAGAVFEELPAPDGAMTARVRLQSGLHLPQMIHCARCRADAVGLIHEKMTAAQMQTLHRFAPAPLMPAGSGLTWPSPRAKERW